MISFSDRVRKTELVGFSKRIKSDELNCRCFRKCLRCLPNFKGGDLPPQIIRMCLFDSRHRASATDGRPTAEGSTYRGA
jgi:hypothetical protein